MKKKENSMIDANILCVSNPGEYGFEWINPNIKLYTKFVDCDDNIDLNGHDFEIWKAELKFGKNEMI